LWGELEHHIVVFSPLTRASEPALSQLYCISGSSALGALATDAIVKSSTNLQNSVSLNSRMLA
jgi:hypothetical protein